MCPKDLESAKPSATPSPKGHRSRLLGRWRKSEPTAFEDYELLELLLFYAIPRKDTKDIAKSLLQRFGSLAGVLNAPLSALEKHPGLGEYSSVLLNLISLLGRRSLASPLKGKKIRSPEDLKSYFLSWTQGQAEETFFLVLLDQGNCVIDCLPLERGIENRAQVYIKKIARVCLDRHATGVFCVHNHPSGQKRFSPADIALTKKIKVVLDALEIRLLDHLLVCEEDMVSMVEESVGPF